MLLLAGWKRESILWRSGGQYHSPLPPFMSSHCHGFLYPEEPVSVSEPHAMVGWQGRLDGVRQSWSKSREPP